MDSLWALEIVAVSMGLIFIILLISENIWCWAFGILSSLAFVFLMYYSRLYSESILYVFYVIIGVYGWQKWSQEGENKIVIHRVSWRVIATVLIFGAVLSYLAGYYFNNYTNAQRPFADATSSVFSILASYMEAHKWLSSWVFWIVINGFSIWLYFDRSLNFSSFLMVIYLLLSIFGFIQWRQRYIYQSQVSQ